MTPESTSTTRPPRRWIRACGSHAALSSRAMGQSVQHAPRRAARPARPLRRHGSRWPDCSGPSPAKSSSPPAAPRPTTWPCKACCRRTGLHDCHLIASAIEHPAVLACCRHLERLGVACHLLPVDPDGLVDPAELERALRPETRLVSIMAANNVTGAVQPIEELGRIAAGTARCSIPTRCKPAGRFRWMSAGCRSICFRSPRTSCTGRKAWGHCMSAAASP